MKNILNGTLITLAIIFEVLDVDNTKVFIISKVVSIVLVIVLYLINKNSLEKE